MTQGCGRVSECQWFADDTTILFQINDMVTTHTEQTLNIELANVSNWLKCNQLSLNPKKTQCIAFGNVNCQDINLVLDNTKILFSNSINLLGIHFDNKLTFANHISKIRNKTSAALGALNRAKKEIPIEYRKQLYFAFIQPIITYGIEVWGGANKTTLKPITTLQNKAIRFIERKKWSSSVSNDFKKHKIIKFSKLYDFQTSLLMYNAFNNKLPSNIQKLYSRNFNRTRQSNTNLVVSRRSTKIQNLRPSINGPFIWNSIPENIKNSLNKQQFRNRLKKFYLNNQ